jgi:hypothetical protein
MDNGHNSKAEACIARVQEVANDEPGSVCDRYAAPRGHDSHTISLSNPVYSLKETFGGEIPKIDLFQADLTDRSSIDKIFAAYENKGKIWGVIHLAVSDKDRC